MGHLWVHGVICLCFCNCGYEILTFIWLLGLSNSELKKTIESAGVKKMRRMRVCYRARINIDVMATKIAVMASTNVFAMPRTDLWYTVINVMSFTEVSIFWFTTTSECMLLSLSTDTFDQTCYRCLDDSVILQIGDLCNGFFQCDDLSDECLCDNSPSTCSQFVKKSKKLFLRFVKSHDKRQIYQLVLTSIHRQLWFSMSISKSY